MRAKPASPSITDSSIPATTSLLFLLLSLFFVLARLRCCGWPTNYPPGGFGISRFKLAAREIDARKVNEIVQGDREGRVYHRWWRCSRFEVFLPCNLFFDPLALPRYVQMNEGRVRFRYYLRIRTLMIKFINLKDKLDRCNWTKKSLEDRIWSRYYLRIGDGIYRLVNNDNVNSIDTNE